VKIAARRIEAIHPVEATQILPFGGTSSGSFASLKLPLYGIDPHTIALADQKELALIEMIQIEPIVPDISATILQGQ
jgi:hypothetical protein